MTKVKVSRKTVAKTKKTKVPNKVSGVRYKTLGDDPDYKYTECVVEIGLEAVFQPFFFRLLIPYIKSDYKDISEYLIIYSLYIKHVIELKSA